jgi:hypothetical protein
VFAVSTAWTSGLFALLGVLVGGLITFRVEQNRLEHERERRGIEWQRETLVELQDLLSELYQAMYYEHRTQGTPAPPDYKPPHNFIEVYMRALVLGTRVFEDALRKHVLDLIRVVADVVEREDRAAAAARVVEVTMDYHRVREALGAKIRAL